MSLDYEYGAKLIDIKNNEYYDEIELKSRGATFNITFGITL
jgi:hypothetical protein